MILALLYSIALLRLIFHCLLPLPPGFQLLLQVNDLFILQSGGITHICLLFGEWRINLSFGHQLQLHGWELTGSSRFAAWHFSDLAPGWTLPKYSWHPAASSACCSPLSTSHPVPEVAEASMWPCFICSALQNALAYTADLMALHYNPHVQRGQTKRHTRPVPVNSARRTVTAEVEGNC